MLKVYTLNLDHRTDRWADACANYEAHGLAPAAVHRFSGFAEPSFGALGCARSHVAALSHFLTHDRQPYALVMEDDFDFVRPFGDVVEVFNQLARHRIEWDTLLLMGTQVLAGPVNEFGVARVIEAQSAAAYLFSRAYAVELLACFSASLPAMERLSAPGLQAFAVSRLAVDQAWKALQRRDRWYILQPSVGHQRPSWSDIEQRMVDYDALTYGLVMPAPAPSPGVPAAQPA